MTRRNNFKILLRLLTIFIIILTLCISSYRYNWRNKDYSDYKVHISVDDTLDLFKDITVNQANYKTIFDNATLSYCKELHDAYGAVFSFYCFYDWNDFQLDKATNKFRDEFIENSDWMKFNFHAFNSKEDLNDIELNIFSKEYKKTINALKNVVGENSIDSFTRLSSFTGSKEVIQFLISNGIKGFYTADDSRNSYYFDSNESKVLFNNEYFKDQNGAVFIKTDLRLDNTNKPFGDIKRIISNSEDKYIEIFTHEWLLNQGGMTNSSMWKIKDICKFTYYYNLQFEQNNPALSIKQSNTTANTIHTGLTGGSTK